MIRKTALGPAVCDPAWSPDGRRLAAVTQPMACGSSRMCSATSRIRASGWSIRRRRRIDGQGGSISKPVWSPDGSRIAYVASNRRRHLGRGGGRGDRPAARQIGTGLHDLHLGGRLTLAAGGRQDRAGPVGLERLQTSGFRVQVRQVLPTPDARSVQPDEARALRRPYIDWLRGVGVLIMIEAHMVDSWTLLSERASPWYNKAMILGGIGAPIFLFLAGTAVALSATSKARRRRRQRRGARRRGGRQGRSAARSANLRARLSVPAAGHDSQRRIAPQPAQGRHSQHHGTRHRAGRRGSGAAPAPIAAGSSRWSPSRLPSPC